MEQKIQMLLSVKGTDASLFRGAPSLEIHFHHSGCRIVPPSWKFRRARDNCRSAFELSHDGGTVHRPTALPGINASGQYCKLRLIEATLRKS